MALPGGDVLKHFKLEEVLRNDTSQLNLLGTLKDKKCVIKIRMARPMVKHVVGETPLLYKEIVLPIIEKQIGDGSSLSWIYNVLNGEKEKERQVERGIFSDPESGYIINVDTKWRSHPDCHSPRDGWCNTDVTHLYCLGIVRSKGIKSLRDLRQHHIPMLRAMHDDGIQIIKQVYGLEAEKMRIFIHYHPSVHFVHLKNDIGVSPEKCHLLMDVIQNLEQDGSCYEKRILQVWLPENSEMYKAIKAASE